MGPIRPTISVESVARAIVRLAERPRREVVVGLTGRLGAIGARLAPALTEYLAGLRAERGHFRRGGVPRKEGNVFAPEHATDPGAHASRQG